MRPSEALERHKVAAREIVKRFPVANQRVFGSILTNEDTNESDIDLLVDALPGASLFDLGGLQVQLEELFGVPVDLVTSVGLSPRMRDRILAEAQPI